MPFTYKYTQGKWSNEHVYTQVPSSPADELLLTATKPLTAATDFKGSCIFWAALKMTLGFLSSLSAWIWKPWPLKKNICNQGKEKKAKRILTIINETALKRFALNMRE